MSDLPIKRDAPANSGRKVATVGAVAAAGAVACGVCCVLPFAVPAAALAGSGGVLAWFGAAQGWATALAAVLVLVAWLWVAVRSLQTRRRPARETLIVLGMATLLFGAAVAWPFIEGELVARLTQSS